MAYDSRAIRVKKADKVVATMMFDKDKKRHFIREMVTAESRNAKSKSARNRGDKNGE